MISPLYILSIDQGTTGTMVLLVDMHGNILTHAYQEFKQHYPEPGVGLNMIPTRFGIRHIVP